MKKAERVLTRKEELILELADGKGDVFKLNEYTAIVKNEVLTTLGSTYSCSKIVEELRKDIPSLTTTIFNQWLTYVRKLGTYDKRGKRRVFQPNESFDIYLTKKGFARTGKTVKGDLVTVSYTKLMLDRFKERPVLLESLRAYTNNVTKDFNFKK